VKGTFDYIKSNFVHFKKDWGLRMYRVMNKLNNKDPDMWKLIYQKIEELIFKMELKDFIFFWEKYHNDTVNVSQEFK
jgi:hypothetical protein